MLLGTCYVAVWVTSVLGVILFERSAQRACGAASKNAFVILTKWVVAMSIPYEGLGCFVVGDTSRLAFGWVAFMIWNAGMLFGLGC